MFRPVTTRTTGPSTSPSWGTAAKAAAAAPSTRIPTLGESAERSRDLALRDEDHAARHVGEDVDRERDRDAHAEAVGEGRSARALDDVAGPPALDHDRRLLRGDADAGRPRCLLREMEPDPAEESAVPDGDDDDRGRFVQLLQDFARDGAVALVLGALGAVLEEGEALGVGESPRRVLRLVEVGALESELRPERLDEVDFRARRVLRSEDDDAQPEALRGPRRRRAVVARRRGDDAVGARLVVRGEDGQRSAPLERAELVDVLALEPEVVTGSEARWRRLERGGEIAHAKRRAGLSDATAASTSSPSSATACKVESTARTGKSLPKTSRPAPQAARQSSSERGPYDAVSR